MTMRILVDENIPSITVETLRKIGHDVLDIRGAPSEGLQDPELWSASQAEAQLLITTDKGFSKHRSESHHGLLIVCLKKPNRLKIHARIMHAINQFSAEDWFARIVIMRDVVQATYKLPADTQKGEIEQAEID